MDHMSGIGSEKHTFMKAHLQPWETETKKYLNSKYSYAQANNTSAGVKPTPEEHVPVPSSSDQLEALSDELFDPACRPDSPHVVSFDEVCAATNRIKSYIVHPECRKSKLYDLIGMNLFYKKETDQFTGSSKDRGACHVMMMLSEEQRRKGVISASFGNHALALSYQGMLFDVPVTVVLPVNSSMMKINNCRKFKATVVIQGRDIKEAKKVALNIAKKQGLLYINGYDHPYVIAAQGSIGLEILDQVPEVDAIIVPVGGGSHLAGIATAVKGLKPHVKVIGVESERCPSFTASLKAGGPTCAVMSDGTSGVAVGCNSFVTSASLIDKMVIVNESAICSAILHIAEKEKVIVEGMGASGLAAILMGQLPELKDKRVVCVFTGGNIDTSILGRCLERGLAFDDRLMKFQVTVSERGGGIAELCKNLATYGAAIKDIVYDRAWIKADVFSCDVSILLEIQNHEHGVQIRQKLTEQYQNVTFPEIPLPCVLGPLGAEEEES